MAGTLASDRSKDLPAWLANPPNYHPLRPVLANLKHRANGRDMENLHLKSLGKA